MVRISAVIVSFNTRDLLVRAIAALRDPSQSVGEIVVVDNASSDGSVETLRELYPEVQIIENPSNRGFATAVNQGIEATVAPYVILLNSDAVPEHAVLRQLADYLDGNEHVAAAAPKLAFPDGRFQPSCGMRFESLATDFFGGDLAWRALGGRRLALAEPTDDAPRSVAWVVGACVMLRRAAISRVGLLDPGFFMYEEDMDLCFRLRRAGYEIVYLPGLRTIHVGGASPRPSSTETLRWKLESRERYARKHWGAWGALARRAAIASGAVLKVLVLTLMGLLPRVRLRAALHQRRLKQLRTLRLVMGHGPREDTP